jgi:hypothetical protein
VSLGMNGAGEPWRNAKNADFFLHTTLIYLFRLSASPTSALDATTWRRPPCRRAAAIAIRGTSSNSTVSMKSERSIVP